MKLFSSQKRKHILVAVLTCLLLFISVFLIKKTSLLSPDARFENFTWKLFQEELSSNTLNLHYTLAYPKKYGIKNYTASLGTMDPDTIKDSFTSLNSLEKKLKKFPYNKLSLKNRIIYDLLLTDTNLQNSLKDKYLLQEPLGPNLGIQAQLPTLLAEYTFRTPEDIKDYFSLLSCIPAYFDSILTFEREKAKQGLFMSDASVQGIIDQCTAFTASKKDSFLSVMFQEKLNQLLQQHVITENQASSYLSLHKKLLKTSVFPAYDALAANLNTLMGTGKNPYGLAYLPKGKSYYQYLIKNNVGDFRSVKEIEHHLHHQLLQDYQCLNTLLQQNPKLLSEMSQLSDLPQPSPENMLNFLSHTITKDFPVLASPDYEIKYIPKALEEFSSPAFYLTPPLDTLSPNTIYINNSCSISPPELFTTLAHEGFPGHLYQTIYFSRQHPDPIREFLSCGGYIEGWATYVESMAYSYAADYFHLDSDLMEFLNRNRCINLCLYSILDIGIHYKGWTPQKVSDMLSSFGFSADEVTKEIYQYIVENPSNYLKYYLGYLNFSKLKELSIETCGDSFQLKEFHKKLLKIGPAPFPIVQKYLLLSE